MKSTRKEMVSVRMPKELNKKLTEHVAAIGISKTAFIISLIHERLNKEKQSAGNPRKAVEEEK